MSPHSIFIIANSVQAFLNSFNSEKEELDKKRKKSEVNKEDHSTLWEVKSFRDEHFWFLKPDDPIDAVEELNSLSSTQSLIEDEQASVNINNLVIKVESGLGNNTVPLILLESSFNCDVRNWSSQRMTLIGSMTLEVAYYNAKLALWEPVLEPVCQIKPDGSELKKRWGINISMQVRVKRQSLLHMFYSIWSLFLVFMIRNNYFLILKRKYVVGIYQAQILRNL